MPPRKKRLTFALVLAYFPLAFAYLAFSGQLAARDWRTASRAPAGLAPNPATTDEAVVQVYSARAVSWRGWFGVHSWIAVKRTHAQEFTVHEVMGWSLRRTGSVVVARARPPDGYWYGNRPELLGDVRGAGVEEIIDRIEKAARRNIRTRAVTTSGRGRIPTPSPRSSCGACRSCASICRRPRSARTI